MKEQKWIVGIMVALMTFAAILFVFSRQGSVADTAGTAEKAAFGQFMKNEGVKFYGASWCTHCQNQKKALGKEAWEPVYIECSSPDGTSQLDVCSAAKIEGYPTWVFKDGTRKTGEIAVDELKRIVGYSGAPIVAATSTK